jgi:cell wall assembly regulator SMI1
MPTSKKRLNMSLPEDIRAALSALAKRDDVTPTTKALHLITLALEIEEDDVWNAIAENRDTNDAQFVSHEDAWA